MKNILILGSINGVGSRLQELMRANYDYSSSVRLVNRNDFWKLTPSDGKFELIIDAAVNSGLTANSIDCDTFVEDELSRVRRAHELLNSGGLYVYFSSNSVYKKSLSGIPITERCELLERGGYVRVKLAAEKFLQDHVRDVLILRLPGIVCRGARNNFASIIYRKLMGREEIYINSVKSMTSNYVSTSQISKVIHYFDASKEAIPCGRVVNLYTWPPISRLDFVHRAAYTLNLEPTNVMNGEDGPEDSIFFSDYHHLLKSFVDESYFVSTVSSDL